MTILAASGDAETEKMTILAASGDAETEKMTILAASGDAETVLMSKRAGCEVREGVEEAAGAPLPRASAVFLSANMPSTAAP